jgi:hypothetical protein
MEQPSDIFIGQLCSVFSVSCFRKQLGRVISGRKAENWERVRNRGESSTSSRSLGNEERMKVFFTTELTGQIFKEVAFVSRVVSWP